MNLRFATTLTCALALVGCSSSSAPASSPGSTPDSGTDPSGVPVVTSAIPLSRCDAPVVDPTRGLIGPVYTASVTLGASQTFKMLLDTGSSSLVVASSSCTDCSGVSPLYTPDADATDSGQQATVGYGAGGVGGELYEGNAQPGDAPKTRVTFLAANQQNGFFSDNPLCNSFEGVFGLGDPLPNDSDYFPELVANGGAANVFSVGLCGDGGSLWLGGFDPSATTGAPQFAPLGVGYRVELSGVGVGGVDLNVAAAGLGQLTVDTGDPLVRLPSAAFDAATQAIGADAQFTALLGGTNWFTQSPPVCTALAKSAAELDAALPHLTLMFGSNPAIAVDAPATASYLQEQPGADGTWCPGLVPNGSASGGGGGGGPGGGSGNGDAGAVAQVGLLGDSFLRSSVVIFDRQNQRIGFAPHTCP